MARYYSSAEGTGRTASTRQGTTSTGISAHTRGWNIGARVDLRPVMDRGKPTDADRLTIDITRGSNGITGDGRTFAEIDAELNPDGTCTIIVWPRYGGTVQVNERQT
jgi:hypothetical protein